MSSRKQIVVTAIATLVTALFACMAAIALSMAAISPDSASQMPLANGDALARSAHADLGRAMQAQASKSTGGQRPSARPMISPDTRTKARSAFLAEPLATSAILVLAYDNASRDDVSNLRIFDLVHQLSKREEAATIWLAQDAARRSDIQATLIYFDEVLRTSSEARPLLLREFAIATKDRRFRSEMVRLLAANPPWVDEFWSQGAEIPEAAASLAELRIRLEKSDVPFDKRADQKIANSLVGQGQFALARQLYESASGKSEPSSAVQNPDFLSHSYMPPVDWETYSNGDFGAEISPKDGVLAAYATQAPGGVVARQWVMLTNPRNRLRVTSRVFGGGEGDKASLVLTCLEVGKASTPMVFDLNNGQTDRDFQKLTGCNNFWLDVRISTGERSVGIDVEFDQISIVPDSN